jgi:hypothetical protein
LAAGNFNLNNVLIALIVIALLFSDARFQLQDLISFSDSWLLVVFVLLGYWLYSD